MPAWPAGGLDISLKKKFNVMSFAMTRFHMLSKCIPTNVNPQFHFNKISFRKRFDVLLS